MLSLFNCNRPRNTNDAHDMDDAADVDDDVVVVVVLDATHVHGGKRDRKMPKMILVASERLEEEEEEGMDYDEQEEHQDNVAALVHDGDSAALTVDDAIPTKKDTHVRQGQGRVSPS